jgi:hypothetical protein
MPTKFSNAHYYRIAGRYIFSGDLFIVRGAIYFFPEVDLSDQRSKATAAWPRNWSLAVQTIVYIEQKMSLYASSIDDLSRKGISDEQFREGADARIRRLKEARQRHGFATSMPFPLPTAISASEISGMRLSRTGRLSLFAQYDNHDFNVGPGRKRRLRDALSQMGFEG